MPDKIEFFRTMVGGVGGVEEVIEVGQLNVIGLRFPGGDTIEVQHQQDGGGTIRIVSSGRLEIRPRAFNSITLSVGKM